MPFKTSEECLTILDAISRKTSPIRRNAWARAAFCYSLSLDDEPVNVAYDSKGQEYSDSMFFGQDRETLQALLRQRIGRAPTDDELWHIIKTHVERGARMLLVEFERLNRRGDELILKLIEQSNLCVGSPSPTLMSSLPSPIHTDSFALRLHLGFDVKIDTSVDHLLNGPGSAPHVAIMGRNGTGKTRTGLCLLKHIHETGAYPVPFLVFDYAKGDIASNTTFIHDTNATAVSIPGNAVPLAPLSIPARDEYSIQLAARRFRDTVCSVVQLGAIQKARCLDLVIQLYEDFGEKTPDLQDLVDYTELEYGNNGWKEDSLLACIREFSTFPLFRSAKEGDRHPLFHKSHVIDIHHLPEDLRKLTVFLLLDRLYTEIMSLPDAPLDDEGNRQLRLIIVIDEAHHYLPCKQPTLERMIREVRSKGVALWLFSQSPDDFDQGHYNFAREMGLSMVFSCVLEKPKMLEAILGGKVDPMRLSRLGTGVALTRLAENDSPIEVQAWKP